MVDEEIARLAQEIKAADAFSALEKAKQLAELATRRYVEVAEKADAASRGPLTIESLTDVLAASETAAGVGDHVVEASRHILELNRDVLAAVDAESIDRDRLDELRAKVEELEHVQGTVANANDQIKQGLELLRATIEKMKSGADS